MNKFSVCVVFLFFVLSTAFAEQEDVQTSICHNSDSKLPFDINKEGRWRMAPGENYHPIALLSEPGLYKVCRNGALFSGKVRVASDTGLQVSTELPISSCVVIYSKRIGIYSEQKVSVNDIVGGTYRVLAADSELQYDDILHVQAQFNPGETPKAIVATEFTYGNPPDTATRKATYRFCQDYMKQTTGMVRGLKINRMPDYLDQQPISKSPAIFGSGSCVDFSGSSVVLYAENVPAPTDVSLICGKLAYKLEQKTSSSK